MISEHFFVDWYRSRGRDFPWRKEAATPYQVLVAEMLLRQTDAESVSKVWDSVFDNYSSIDDLAEANQEELKDHIEVLGFGTMRSNALIDAAQYILSEHEGQIPGNRPDLLEVPHVGRYGAGAVACFAYGVATPIVDNSIKRFLGRYYGEDYDRDIRRADGAWARAEELLPSQPDLAKAHNYGLLDFIAEICTSRNPKCGGCPIRTSCVYGSDHLQDESRKELS